MATVDELLGDARRRLKRAPFAPSRREAALLLGHVLGLDEAQVMARGERVVDAASRRRFGDLLARRLTGEPFAYLVGEREFYGRPFFVDSRVLIPRPETEHLVEEALAPALGLPERPRVLDLGTGSGCLAVTLALELGGSAVGLDLSPAALAVARSNVARYGLDGRIALFAGDLAVAVDLSRFDLVVSNPPYIEEDERHLVSSEILDFEPATALFPPAGGVDFFARLFDGLDGLRSGVPTLIEIGYRQGPAVAALLQEQPFALEAIRPDYDGRDRIVRARRL